MDDLLPYLAATSVGYFVYNLTGDTKQGIIAAFSISILLVLLNKKLEELKEEIEGVI